MKKPGPALEKPKNLAEDMPREKTKMLADRNTSKIDNGNRDKTQNFQRKKQTKNLTKKRKIFRQHAWMPPLNLENENPALCSVLGDVQRKFCS